MDEADSLTAELLESNSELFANHYVLDRTPWLFASRRQYVEWKIALAKGLAVDPYSIIVVGSACTGFSLSPSKNFSSFHSRSDIDVAVISVMHFDQAWRWLRDLSPVAALGSKNQHRLFEEHRSSLVFDGTIATDKLLGRLPFGTEWRTALLAAGKRDPTRGHSVKTRIYRDIQSLREYQVRSITKLRTKILADRMDAGSEVPEALSTLDEQE
ncbi:hypothetical protein AB0F49_17515 [Micromonospora ureilytica]|uniref:hypothetical protein n=1 Tax=Micromonospora ureilytica TaxID=709868 RepID=UPI0033CC834D